MIKFRYRLDINRIRKKYSISSHSHWCQLYIYDVNYANFHLISILYNINFKHHLQFNVKVSI